MKNALLVAILVCFLNGCAKYQPVVDTVGRSGTFNESKAERISDDIILCQELAKTNTTFLGNINHWILSQKLRLNTSILLRLVSTIGVIAF